MSETLAEKTIAVLQRDGWVQGARVNLQGERCLLGAIMYADHGVSFGTVEVVGGEVRRLWRAIHEELGREPMSWNDHVAETVEDVILVVKRAGATLE